eukprot:1980090-Pyramimonas_sp.AAC.1
MQAGWGVDEPTAWTVPPPHEAAGGDWRFDDGMYTGDKAIDSHAAFLEDCRFSMRCMLWNQASRHSCGTGLEGGVGCASYR